MTDLQRRAINMKDVFRLAPRFEAMFSALRDVMSKQSDGALSQPTQSTATPISSGSRANTRKRSPTDPVSTVPSKRTRKVSTISPPPEPTTPDQPTFAVDPNLTSSTRESGDEESTKVLLRHFLMGALSVLDLQTIDWQNSGCVVELSQTYYCPFVQH